ncbi:MAG: hypothetical protein WBD27_03540 [Pyrinomonadaceae bacterium]
MVEPKRTVWKIIVGIILVLVMGSNLPLYLGGSTQANAGLAMSIVAIVGGLYLIYRGLYPLN